MNARTFWLALFALHIILRLPSFYTPLLDIDEAQFAGFARTLMDGGLPYRDSLDTKPLGIYLFYQLVFTLFGKHNMPAVHTVTALLHFLIAILLSQSLKLLKQEGAGRIAAVAFILFSTTFIPKFLATSINAVMIFFLMLSFYFTIKNTASHRWINDTLAALCLGLAFLFKYTAGIQLVFFFLFAFYTDRGFKAVKRCLCFSVIFSVPFALHFLYLKHLGVEKDFLEWSLHGSAAYITHGSETINFLQSFATRFGGYMVATLPLWLLVTPAMKKNLKDNPAHVAFLLWFFVSLIPVFVGGRFYGHYFLHPLPALCGVASLSFVEVSHVKMKKILLTLTAISSLLFFIARLSYPTYLKTFPDEDVDAQRDIGLTIKNMAKPTDSLLVWGFATGIDFYAGLKSASRFLWSDLLTGRTPGPDYARRQPKEATAYTHPLAWQLFREDLQEDPPTFFVDTSVANIHDYGRFPLNKYPWLENFVSTHYTKIATPHGVDVYKLKGDNP